MCGKACQIPASMARDLPRPCAASERVCAPVCGWEMPVGCKHECYEKTDRLQKGRRKMAKQTEGERFKKNSKKLPVYDCPLKRMISLEILV